MFRGRANRRRLGMNIENEAGPTRESTTPFDFASTYHHIYYFGYQGDGNDVWFPLLLLAARDVRCVWVD